MPVVVAGLLILDGCHVDWGGRGCWSGWGSAQSSSVLGGWFTGVKLFFSLDAICLILFSFNVGCLLLFSIMLFI